MSASTTDLIRPHAAAAATPLTSREAQRLGARIQAHASHIAESTCAFLLLIEEFERRGALVHYDGLKTLAHWLSWSCSMAPGTAREHVRIARALPAMPRTTAAFSQGRLSYSKVREMTRISGLVEEEALVTMALDMTASQLARTVAGFRAAEGTRLPQDARREAAWRVREDGMVEIRALLPAELGAEVITALDLSAHREMDGAGVDGAGGDGAEVDRPTRDQSRADALVDLARCYTDAAPADRSGEDRHLVIVHATPDMLIGADPSPDVPAGTLRDRSGIEGVGPIEQATAQRLACTAQLSLLVTDGDGEVLHLGRSRRLASRAQRRALRAVQSTCQHPGCHQSRHLDAHHLIPWSRGGPTDIENLVLLCRRHHVLVHEGGLRLRRLPSSTPGAQSFTVVDQQGRPVSAQWPRLADRPHVRLLERPMIIEDTGDPLPTWGVGDARIAPRTAGFGYDRDRAVGALLDRRPLTSGRCAPSAPGTPP